MLIILSFDHLASIAFGHHVLIVFEFLLLDAWSLLALSDNPIPAGLAINCWKFGKGLLYPNFEVMREFQDCLLPGLSPLFHTFYIFSALIGDGE